MANQTAVEWLLQEYSIKGILTVIDFAQAKQIEKIHHEETFKQSRQAKIFEEGMPPVWENFEQYYNETYGKKI